MQKINVILEEAARTANELDPTGMLISELGALTRERDDLLATLVAVRNQSIQAQRVGQRYQTACGELEQRSDSMAAELAELRQVSRSWSRARAAAVRIENRWREWTESENQKIAAREIAAEFVQVLRFLGVRLPSNELLETVRDAAQPSNSDAPTDVNATGPLYDAVTALERATSSLEEAVSRCIPAGDQTVEGVDGEMRSNRNHVDSQAVIE